MYFTEEVYNCVKKEEIFVRKALGSIDKGIIYMLFASFLFALMGAFAKVLSEHLPSIEIVFFRNIFGVFLIGATIWKLPLLNQGHRPWLLFFRGLMGFTALLAFFYNIAHISLADAMSFSKTSPIFTALLAYLFLIEGLSKKAWFALLLGFNIASTIFLQLGYQKSKAVIVSPLFSMASLVTPVIGGLVIFSEWASNSVGTIIAKTIALVLITIGILLLSFASAKESGKSEEKTEKMENGAEIKYTEE